MIRVLRPNGEALITVWSKNQEDAVYAENKNSDPNSSPNPSDNFKQAETGQILDIHKSRTSFKSSDLLVPWKLNDKTYHRYYHIFQDQELESICQKVAGCQVISNELDNGNFVLKIRKV